MQALRRMTLARMMDTFQPKGHTFPGRLSRRADAASMKIRRRAAKGGANLRRRGWGGADGSARRPLHGSPAALTADRLCGCPLHRLTSQPPYGEAAGYQCTAWNRRRKRQPPQRDMPGPQGQPGGAAGRWTGCSTGRLWAARQGEGGGADGFLLIRFTTVLPWAKQNPMVCK